MRDPTTQTESLRGLPPAERYEVVERWNDTKAEYPSERCIHELFEAQVEKRPEAVALVYEGQQLTYAELNARANQLGHYLRQLGVKPDERVAICVERGLEMVVGLLAVLKAGGAYVPLDPAYPAERLSYMLKDSEPVVLLTQGELAQRLNGVVEGSLPVLDLTAPELPWASRPTTNLDPAQVGLNSSHLAYVIYTSGSTGQPKGVMVEHRSIINSTVARIAAYAPFGRFLLIPPITFDSSVAGIFGILTGGETLIIADKGAIRDPFALRRCVEALQINSLLCAPSLYQQVLNCDHLPGSADINLSLVIVAGETCSHALVAQSAKCEPETSVYNEYGPTEATIWATHYKCGGQCTNTVPIGRPIANTRVYILDPNEEPVPVGVAGELYIAGAGVARGYLKRPELTAERFLADAFSAAPGARMYRTGDLGRWLPDGNIELLGRNDFQVKVRGFRIELGEIEAKLTEYPGVSEAVVVAPEDAPGDKRLIAYYVAKGTLPESDGNGVVVDAAALREHLSGQLPDYMVPAAYVRVEAFPLTPNGKLDRKALPAPQSDAYVQRKYEAPQGEIESRLAEIWAELLKVDRVGRYDNFFELGGHSLLATRIANRFTDSKCVLRAGDILRGQTLASVSQIITRSERGFVRVGKSPIADPQNRPSTLVAAASQAQVFVLEKLVPQNRAYQAQSSIRFEGCLDRRALNEALNILIRRHEILRTTFHLIDGQPVQKIHPPWKVELTVIDLAEKRPNEQRSAMEVFLRDETSVVLNPSELPLCRWTLFKLSATEHVFLQVEHHFIHDGWSSRLFVSELGEFYCSLKARGAPRAPALAFQFADYCIWQQEFLQSTEAKRLASEWKTYLRGAETVLELPTARKRSPRLKFTGGQIRTSIGMVEMQKVTRFAAQIGLSTFHVLFGAFALFFNRYTRQFDFILGTSVANRNRREFESVIGMIVNLVPVRFNVRGTDTAVEFLRKARDSIIWAQDHGELPFVNIVEAVRPTRRGNVLPLVQIGFNFHDSLIGEPHFEGLSFKLSEALPNGTAKFDIDVIGIPDGDTGTIELLWEFNDDLFDTETVVRMANHYRAFVDVLVKRPTEQIQHLRGLPPAERYEVVERWNDTKAAYPSERCIHELFEAQVEKRPEAVALVYEGQQLTYAELNARANQLGHYLRQLGVKPDERVAICVERGLDMVVGLLAVLKAGGAYVPLDPAYPAERLCYMLKDSEPVVLLTQGELAQRLNGVVEGSLPVLDLTAPELPWASHPTTNLDPAQVGLNSRHLAYVIYTSGSTGQPKGVMVEHRSVLRLVINSSFAQITLRDCVAHCANPAFDASTWEVWGALLNGAKLLIVSQPVFLDPKLFLRCLTEGRVTALWLTVGIFNEYVDKIDRALGDLNYLLIGGDVVDPKKVARLLRRECRPKHLVNGYGPTETTTFASTFEIRTVKNDGSTIPIGRPIANTRIYILDPYGEPVPVGIAGELYIGGAGIARGYLKRPDLTAQRFLADPFSAEAGARMYRTGDLGRWLPDGNIEFLGRNDFQVKVRGYRIELGEIEAKLSEHPGIAEAVVVAREDTPGDKRLVAYYVAEERGSAGAAHPQSGPIAEELRSHLLVQLPEYMVPAAYVRLTAFPLTPNGKLDRKALPMPEGEAYVVRGYEAPQGELEMTLAEIWAELLKVERVGRHDNFFELGGHSLLATRVVTRMRAHAGVSASLKDLFSTQSLAELTQRWKEIIADHKAAASEPKQSVLKAAVPSLGQELHSIFDGGPARRFNIMTAAMIERPIAEVENGVLQVIDETSVLRSYFLKSNDGLTLKYHRQIPIRRVAVEKSGELSASSHFLRMLDLARQEDPFDVFKGPLCRTYLSPLSESETIVLFDISHIIIDGVSVELLWEQIATKLSGILPQGYPPPAFEQYVAEERAWATRERMDAAAQYWRDKCANVPREINIPCSYPPPEICSHHGLLVSTYLSQVAQRRLIDRAQKLRTSTFTIFAAAFGKFLVEYCDTRAVPIGAQVENRHLPGYEETIGYFTSGTILVSDRKRISGGVDECIQEMRSQLVETLKWNWLPNAMKMRAAGFPERPPAFNRMPFYYNHFSGSGGDQNLSNGERAIGFKRLDIPARGATETIADIGLYSKQIDDAITTDLLFNADLFSREAAINVAGIFKEVLSSFL